MAALASGHPARFVEEEMGLAEALGYQALWLEIEGNITAPLEEVKATEKRL